jgi:acetyl-CoA C-acetyltransferase
MSVDPETPVLVGVGAVQQRLDDFSEALEPVELMVNALERAAEDMGSRELLERADWVCVPRGFWDYRDPGAFIAEKIGAARARTQLSEIGVLQTTLLGRAASAIASGSAEVVLIAGGEAKYRDLRAKIAGADAPLVQQGEIEPDDVIAPAADILTHTEMVRGLPMPVQQYSIIENATRSAAGMGIGEHRRQVAEMWADFSRVAADNPVAWNRQRLSATEISSVTPRNKMLAFPYTKLHNSQWNVDQAAGLILCSASTASAAGIPEERWIYPMCVAESNHMLPLSLRRELDRSPGFRIAGRRALEAAQVEIGDVAHLELYSCFPAAVRVQAAELGIPLERQLTETGGMAFAGGPLNNFVLQAAVRMAEVLRADPGGIGMLNAISGMITKQGVSLWSADPPRASFRHLDVSDEVAKETPVCEVDPDYRGAATIASYTVLYLDDTPARGIAFCDAPDGRRAIAVTTRPELARAMTEEEFCGRAVEVGAENVFETV